MFGHVVTQYLRENTKHHIRDIGPRRQVFDRSLLCDLYNKESVVKLIEEYAPDIVVNCVGVLVRASEERKSDAVWFNAYFPHLLSQVCDATGARFLHISTDCVFSGESGPYIESSRKDGIDFYGRTKALGEPCGAHDLTIRTSIIGPELRNSGTGLFEWFLRQEGVVQGYTKALWSGVTTLELAKFIAFVIDELLELNGLVHYAVPGGISKYDLLCEIRKVFKKNIDIQPVASPVLDKRLKNTRRDFCVAPPAYTTQLEELNSWIEGHESFYATFKETT